MNNLEEYINSGILEEYCLDLLNPEQKQEVEKIAQANPLVQSNLEKIKTAVIEIRSIPEISLPLRVKEKTWDHLENILLEKTMDPQHLPLINFYSDANQWKMFVKSQLPEKLESSNFLKLLREDGTVMQAIVWTRSDYPEEVHNNEQESILILEGECECLVGNKLIQLKEGDYYEMPLHIPHTMSLRTPELLALMQRVKIS
jgi:mannose-6-phosphate isomerase-like protein (cupin superfamily)